MEKNFLSYIMLHDMKYGEPPALKEENNIEGPNEILLSDVGVGDVISIGTYNDSRYEFKVSRIDDKGVFVEFYQGKETLANSKGYISGNSIKLNEIFKYGGNQTSGIKKFHIINAKDVKKHPVEDKNIESINGVLLSDVSVGDIVSIDTCRGSHYEFKVSKIDDNGVFIEFYKGKETLKNSSGYISDDAIKIGSPLYYGECYTSAIEKVTLIKNK